MIYMTGLPSLRRLQASVYGNHAGIALTVCTTGGWSWDMSRQRNLQDWCKGNPVHSIPRKHRFVLGQLGWLRLPGNCRGCVTRYALWILPIRICRHVQGGTITSSGRHRTEDEYRQLVKTARSWDSMRRDIVPHGINTYQREVSNGLSSGGSTLYYWCFD